MTRYLIVEQVSAMHGVVEAVCMQARPVVEHAWRDVVLTHEGIAVVVLWVRGEAVELVDGLLNGFSKLREFSGNMVCAAAPQLERHVLCLQVRRKRLCEEIKVLEHVDHGRRLHLSREIVDSKRIVELLKVAERCFGR